MNMVRRYFIIPWVATLLCVGGCASRLDRFLGAKAISIIRGAARVEVFRIDPGSMAMTQPPKPTLLGSIADYPITAKGKEKGEAFASRIAAILLDEKTYMFDRAKGCIFSPGVVFRLWKGKESVDVILCFSCDELEIIAYDASGKPLNNPHEIHEDFDPARPALLKLAKEAFPDDALIQSLTNRAGSGE